MKKLFLFLFAAVLFAACSSDDAEETGGESEGKKYKVSFNVENFEMIESNLKSGDSISGIFPFYVICDKETGKGLITGDYADTITAELEAGNYIIAIMHSHHRNPLGTFYYPTPLADFNFYTAKERGVPWQADGENNYTLYYGKLEFSVGENSNNESAKKIVLEPMWSELEIEITDYATCYLPPKTTAMDCTTYPYYYGFNFKDGTPAYVYGPNHYVSTSSSNTLINGFREGTYRVRKVVSESKDVTVKIAFFEKIVSGTYLLQERAIYKGDLPRGKRITLRGALGSSSNGSASFTPVLGDLTDGGVIPFNR